MASITISRSVNKLVPVSQFSSLTSDPGSTSRLGTAGISEVSALKKRSIGGGGALLPPHILCHPAQSGGGPPQDPDVVFPGFCGAA